MKTLLCFVLFALILPGCSSFHQTPFITYPDKVALADTAIFTAFDAKSVKNNDSRVAAVDEKELSGFTEGNPYWVRVLPGNHQFRIRYTTNYQMTPTGPTYSWAILNLAVDAMQARHVYVARFAEVDGKVRVTAEDMGESPDFSITPDNHAYKAGF